MFSKLKLKLLKWLICDMCKRDDCSKCSFCKMYRDKPVFCTLDRARLVDEAKRVWKVKD